LRPRNEARQYGCFIGIELRQWNSEEQLGARMNAHDTVPEPRFVEAVLERLIE